MRPKPPLSSVTILALRKAKGLTDAELGERAGMSEKMANLYQSGSREPKGEVRERLVAALDCAPGADVPVERALERACRPGEEPLSPVDLTPAERSALARATLAGGLAWADAAEERLVRFLRARRAERARRKADPLWEVLRRCPSRRRRLLIEVSEPYQRWYVAERLAHESERAASHRPALALELAELALRAAELSPGTDLWHARMEGYGLLFVSNARRVQGDLHRADADLARAEDLLKKGAPADPGLLAPWRLPDRKASLRRAQRRFEEALDLHDEALALGPETAGRILLNKSATLEQMGEAEQALEVLEQAEPKVEAQGEPNLLFALRFNRAAALLDLNRAREAEELLPRVRELALELRQDLHLVRLRWLEGRVHAGLDRTEEAIKALEEVREKFAKLNMAYDCALASVKLGALYLRQGRTGEVKALARWMEQVFRSLGIHQEALKALLLFCNAVRQEWATAELAERLFSYLQRARHDPGMKFQE
jgi:tetratricopeptide (TPR) repeat protein